MECGEWHVDFSRQHVSHGVLESLVALARACEVHVNIDDLFSGAVLNTTEHRAAAHVMLRSASEAQLAQLARAQRARAVALAESVRSGSLRSATGDAFTDVVSIGIGGSDLGNVVVHDALSDVADGPSVHFVSTVDPRQFDEVVLHGRLNPATTLFVVASKTFTTAETMHVAERAREYLRNSLGDSWCNHVMATTAAPNIASAWGVPRENILEFWDWVGGRFSVSSVVGFPLMVAFGGETFEELLAGMRLVDDHFRSTPLHANAPALHAMLAVWNTSIKHRASWAVIPYAHAMRRFPAFLQQLMMESNGKSVSVSGRAASEPTSPVVWGEPGTNAQHSFFQLLHQGTSKVPVDFIGFARGRSDDVAGQSELIANLVAQSSALAFGRTSEETRAQGIDEALIPHRSFEGNRPSTVLLAPRLTPSTLGQLIAFYEHSTVVQGWMWEINSFDQWGVELGKDVARGVRHALESGDTAGLDGAASALVKWVRTQQ